MSLASLYIQSCQKKNTYTHMCIHTHLHTHVYTHTLTHMCICTVFSKEEQFTNVRIYGHVQRKCVDLSRCLLVQWGKEHIMCVRIYAHMYKYTHMYIKYKCMYMCRFMSQDEMHTSLCQNKKFKIYIHTRIYYIQYICMYMVMLHMYVYGHVTCVCIWSRDICMYMVTWHMYVYGHVTYVCIWSRDICMYMVTW